MKVCWNITSRCNQNCKYCFRFCKDELPLDKNLEILNGLIKSKVERISWTGGEPYLYKDFLKLLKVSKEANILNYVNTNACNLKEETLNEQLKNIDRLIISLDFVDDKLNFKYGIGEFAYNHINKILSLIKRVEPKIEIQINTVLFRGNLQYIDEIYKELCKHDIDYWKIIRFFPVRGKALEEKNNLTITNEEFQDIVFKYKEKKQNFKINIHGINEMKEKHIIILSSGEVVYSENLGDKKINSKILNY